ncbi:FCS-Like Zinc finger 1-like [Miscanthus floridulus]|uniref:FCS-Like Zinc finger 1-like n=1 Tax=Miscanthus floridulus TaxID=154761 RepID=UPI003458885C
MATSLACAGFFFDTEPIGEPRLPALNACALCSKPLTRNSDIFMYKGDTPFCSEDCRYEQMHHDAAYARQASSSRRKQQQQSQRSRGASVVAKADVYVAS